MKHLISVNSKITNNLLDKDWINFWQKVDEELKLGGFELIVDINDMEDLKYKLKIIDRSIRSGYQVQIHTCGFKHNIEERRKAFFVYDEINKLGVDVFTYHPVVDITKNTLENITTTLKEIELLNDLIWKHGSKKEISLENLSINDPQNITNNITLKSLPLIFKIYPNLRFTWDIGHMVHSNEDYHLISENMFYNLKNVHIHDFYDNNDHQPFYYNSFNREKYFDILKLRNYQGGVVYEYDVNELKGDTFEERMKNYIKNFK